MAAESLLFLRQKDLAKHFTQVKRQLFSRKFSNLLPSGPGVYSMSARPVSKAREPCPGQKTSAGAIWGGAGTGGAGSTSSSCRKGFGVQYGDLVEFQLHKKDS